MFTITQRPELTVGQDSTEIPFKWNEVGNPIVYKGQRRDFICVIQDNGSGNAQMLFLGQDLTADLIVSDIVYFQGLDLYQGRLIELTSVTLVGSDTEVDFATSPGTQDIPFVGADDAFVNVDTKENYRIQYQVFRTSDDAELNSVIFESSDSPGLFEIVAGDTIALEEAGNVIMNVSPIIRPYLIADIDADLTSIDTVYDDTNAYVGFYIKYQEVWNGDSETLVDDSANDFFAVLGARQIPSEFGGNLLEYTTPYGDIVGESYGQASTSEVSPSPGTYEDASVLVSPDETGNIFVEYSVNITAGIGVSQIGQVNLLLKLNGATVFTYEILDFSVTEDTLTFSGSSQFTPLDFGAPGFDEYLVQIVIDPGSGGFSSVSGSAEVFSSELAKFLTKFDRPKMWRGFPFVISAVVGEIDSTSTVLVEYFDASGGGLTSGSTSIDTYENGIFIFDVTKDVPIPDTATTCVLTYNDFGNGTDLAIITCDVVSPCENPIMLLCRNSLGGVMQWVFDGSTEMSPDYGQDRKAMRRVLFAENINENEWNCLQDFIRLGEVYRNNIIEFTSETIKTSTRIGHQVYTLDSEGNKIGVLAIPTRNRTETKQKKHKFELEIEYPEEFTP